MNKKGICKNCGDGITDDSNFNEFFSLYQDGDVLDYICFPSSKDNNEEFITMGSLSGGIDQYSTDDNYIHHTTISLKNTIQHYWRRLRNFTIIDRANYN